MHHVASSTSSPEMCVSLRGSLWVWRYEGPNLPLSSAPEWAPAAPPNLPTQTHLSPRSLWNERASGASWTTFWSCHTVQVVACACLKPSRSYSPTVQPPARTPNTGKLPPLEATLPTTICPPNLHGLPRRWTSSTSTHHDVSKIVRVMSRIDSIVTL